MNSTNDKLFFENTGISEKLSDIKSTSLDHNFKDIKFKLFLLKSDSHSNDNTAKNLMILLTLFNGNNHYKNTREYRNLNQNNHFFKNDGNSLKRRLSDQLTHRNEYNLTQILSKDSKGEQNYKNKIPVLLFAFHSHMKPKSQALSRTNTNFNGIPNNKESTIHKNYSVPYVIKQESSNQNIIDAYIPVLMKSRKRLISKNSENKHKLKNLGTNDLKSNYGYDHQNESYFGSQQMRVNHEPVVEPVHKFLLNNHNIHKTDQLLKLASVESDNKLIDRRLEKKIPVILLPLIYKIDN